MIKNLTIHRELLLLLIGFVAYLVTFPEFIPVYGAGLDPSYVWVFNYLINEDYQSLVNLIYPIGPLGFLKYAAAYENNLLVALIFFSAVKISFLFFILSLGYIVKNRITVFHFLVAVVVGYFSGIDFSIIGSTVMLLLLFSRSPKKYQYFFLANLFAVAGLFIKSSIGIAAYSSIFTFLVLGLVSRSTQVKKLIYLSGLSLSVFLIFGLFVFQSFSSFLSFLNGLIHLAGGYSSGLALFPDNNWWLLSGFILSVIAFPFFTRRKEDRAAFFILLLPLFAMWKHAMGREDIYHARLLIGFLVVFWGIIFVDTKKYKPWHFILPLVSITLFSINLQHIFPHAAYPIKLNGISNFTESIIHYENFNEKYKSISRKNIELNKVRPELKNLIDESIVDVYPWDLSYIPANNFNWKPRRTVELGASTSKWLSNKSAEQFEGKGSPDFVILHLVNDKWGSRFGSLDGRYLLNDEPKVVYNLLDNYKLKVSGQKFLLFEKTPGSNIESSRTTSEQIAGWGEWIEVPESKGEIIRLQFFNKTTLLAKLKSFLYKGEGYYIDYKLKSAKIISYRFLASNAQDGLWINPLILNPGDKDFTAGVSQIRFRCIDQRMVKDVIQLRWELLELNENKTVVQFFQTEGSRDEKSFKTVYEHILISGESQKVAGNSFSLSFQNKLDSLWSADNEQIRIEAELKYKFETEKSNDVMLVISAKGSGEEFWISSSLTGDQNQDEWKYAYLEKTLSAENHKSGQLSIYVWNNGSATVLIDDFQIRIKAKVP